MTRRWAVVIAGLLLGFASWSTPLRAQGSRLIVTADGDFVSIAAALAAAQPGDTIGVHGGIHPAPRLIDKSVSLIGVDDPVIDGQGIGSLVIITAPDTHFEGFIVRSSGANLNHEDTGIVVQAPGSPSPVIAWKTCSSAFTLRMRRTASLGET
ncbi:MAG: hypothetical protein IPK19_26885 [Chloroflexi bacterium]|nr:hypothetical protein [Chloroflexota bacterium]